jgi:Coenzyme PQQ synthesis protein D (PqqD)
VSIRRSTGRAGRSRSGRAARFHKHTSLRCWLCRESSSFAPPAARGLAMTNPTPKAKTERLIVREIDGETLVYDRSRDAASCLNEFAARVWRECDGETSVAAIAAALGEDERAVWLALHQLTKAQLLTEAIAFPPDISAAKSRREIGARLGLGAAAFFTSIVAPMPVQAASCLPINARCIPLIFDRDPCCSGLACFPFGAGFACLRVPEP